MKLIIQIPCYNESESLPSALAVLPREIPGIDQIEVLVIDDGSDDDTSNVARHCGADHIVRLSSHVGLASAFAAGLDACLKLGADIIVNTDADNQYDAEDIPHLLEPVLRGSAELVIGNRGVANLPAFSPLKRRLQILGSHVVSKASGLDIPDATSGFRAMSRENALRTIIVSNYSYTLETLIQAGNRRARVIFIPVRTNSPKRPSRLMRSISDYLMHSSVTILRSYTMYRPLRVFLTMGVHILLIGFLLLGRFLVFYILGQGQGHVQSVVIGGVLLIVGFQTMLIGLLADLISFNRKILEELLYKVRVSETDRPPTKTDSTPV